MASVAALFVETDGGYFGLPDVDPWDEGRDARAYDGPLPVVAHPPCQRWGRFWHGSPLRPHQFRKGADGGCFASALTAVRNWGGVLEHPASTSAWGWFGLATPPIAGGWVPADRLGGWTCHVEQGHYGHDCPKPSWLYVAGVERPELIWGPSGKSGRIELFGGKHKTRLRNATPPRFRDLLISIARGAPLGAPAQLALFEDAA